MRTRDEGAIGAGLKDRLVVIEQDLGKPRSTSGQLGADWKTWQEWWVHEEPLTGTESFVAMQLAAKVNTRFRGDYVAGLTPKRTLRIKGADGRLYDIVSVREIGRRAGHEVLAWARAE